MAAFDRKPSQLTKETVRSNFSGVVHGVFVDPQENQSKSDFASHQSDLDAVFVSPSTRHPYPQPVRVQLQPPAAYGAKPVVDGSRSLGRNAAKQVQRDFGADSLQKIATKKQKGMGPSPSGSLDRAADKLDNVPPSSTNFATKLSKSFYDLTSGDRLKNWKAKLPSYKKKPSPQDSEAWKSHSAKAVRGNRDIFLPKPVPKLDLHSTNLDETKAFKSELPTSSSATNNNNSASYQYDTQTPYEPSSLEESAYDLAVYDSSRGRYHPHLTEQAHGSEPLGSKNNNRNSLQFDSQYPEVYSNNHQSSQDMRFDERSHRRDYPAPPPHQNKPRFRPSKNGNNNGDPKYRHSIGVILGNSLDQSTGQLQQENTTCAARGPPPAYMEHRTKKTSLEGSLNDRRAADCSNYEELNFPEPWTRSGAYKPPEQLSSAKNTNYESKTSNTNIGAASTSHHGYGGSEEHSQLPPPAKITPFGGILNSSRSEIVRPIAFKPVKPSKSTPLYVSSPEPSRRPSASAGTELDDTSDTSSIYYVSGSSHPPSKYGTPSKYVSDSEAIRKHSDTSGTPRHHLSDSEGVWTRSSHSQLHRAIPLEESYAPRPVPNAFGSPLIKRKEYGSPFQPPVPSSGPNKSSSSNSDYDFVPEFVDYGSSKAAPPNSPGRTKRFPNLLAERDICTTSQACESLGDKQQQLQQPSLHQSSVVTTSPKNHQSSGDKHSLGSRQSSGIHVTPSPSDSGVAELENALKEKEGELMILRNAMEQNEEVIIKVYQEKEGRWQDKLTEWSHRLEASVANEQNLLAQVQKLQDERTALQLTVQNLTADKQGLQRKCKEIESELFDVRDRLKRASNRWAICRQCGDVFMPSEHDNPSHAQNGHTSDPTVSYKHSAQSPKDFSHLRPPHNSSNSPSSAFKPPKSPTPTEELRQEIGLLRHEVDGLKDTLSLQISAFTQERGRWEQEKKKVVEYQKLLQNNYVSVYNRNQELEEKLSSNPGSLSNAESGSRKRSSMSSDDQRADNLNGNLSA